MADPFSIAEQIPNGKRVDLRDHDLPFGRPRKGAAFDVGGPVEHETIYLHGRTTPILHVAQARFHPLQVKGHLRDRYTATQGHALAQMAVLEQIRQNARLLTLTWGRMTWSAFLEDAKFGVEGTADLTYELRFKVLRGPSASSASPAPQVETAPADLTARVRAVLAARRSQMLATLLSRVAVAAVNDAFDAADRALDATEQAAGAFEVAVPPPRAEARQLIGHAADTQQRLLVLGAWVRSSASTDVLVSPAAGDLIAFALARHGAADDVATASDAMRSLQFSARQALNRTARIYQVAPGDTLEGIAARQLGSAGRVGELGLRPQDLVLGRIIHLPEA